MRRVVESTGMAAGTRRLAALLTTNAGPAEPGPLEGLSAGQRQILAMLRTRSAGATAALVASETGLSASHVRRCLPDLREAGFVETEPASVMWGYRPQRLKIWRLEMNERTIAALPQMGWSAPPPEPPSDGVPGEFWWLFWSGACASQLRIPEDAVHVADSLVGGPDPAARAWALETLPLWALQELRTMRGYDAGEASRWLDFTLKQRRVFAAPTRGENPGYVRRLAPPAVVAGLKVASLADLLAMKLDVIMYRPKPRDFMDLAAIDSSGELRLEDGIQLHMRRYGTHPQSAFLDRIVDRLEAPEDLADDPEFAAHAERVLGYLASRVPAMRAQIKRMRRDLHHDIPPPPRRHPASLQIDVPGAC